MRLFLCEVVDQQCGLNPWTLPVSADDEMGAAQVVGYKLMDDDSMPGDGDYYEVHVRLVVPSDKPEVLREGKVAKFTVRNDDGVLVTQEMEKEKEQQPEDLTREELVAVVSGVIREMYHEGKDTAWDAETLTEVAGVLKKYNLIPLE